MKVPLCRLTLLNYYSDIFFSLLVFTLFWLMPATAQEIETNTIKASAIVKQVNRTGKLGFKRTINLSFKSSGYLKELYVDEGDTFIAGQLLAELDTVELIAKKNASYARLLQAKREVKRILTLINNNLSSQQALDDAKTNVDTSRANFKVAEYNLIKAKLYAPFNGVVLRRFSELGELQSPNQSTLQLAAIDKNLVVRVALIAEEVSLMKLQQQVEINIDKYGTFNGIISKIPAIANQQSHLFTIEVLLTDLKSTQIAVGQLANLTTQIMTDQLAYRLPIAALNRVDNQGRAVIMLKESDSMEVNSYKLQAFAIHSLSNNYIYLSAQENSPAITVVIKGWQQLNLTGSQSSENIVK